jgi:eukaryotic-like serine/threonine-protein kinase
MVTESGQIKLTDFGIAKDLDATALTATGRTLGTAAYMAPEQIRGTPAVSHKTDLYALGIVMYQMLTGRLAFEGNSAVVLMHAHMNAPAPRPSGKVAEIPRALDDLVTQLMAKAPADRPWDATAVGDVLETMLQKAKKGEPLAMVWPGRDEAVNPSGAPRPLDDAPRPKKKSGRSRSRSGSGSGETSSDQTRRRLEIGGMVLALVAIAAIFAYTVWPPSQQYLYHQAERLMATEDRHKWYEARDNYLDPLDHRFPDHPYKEATRAWRDRILLTDAEGRARTLESPAQTQLSKPQNKQEERYVVYFTRATASEKLKDDRGAAAVWDELDKQLQPNDSEDRPWHLLARKRADDLHQTIAQRQEIVMKLMEQAKVAVEAGRLPEAMTIRNEVIAKYGPYTDVAELLGLAPGGAPPASVPGATQPPPATPAGPPSPVAPDAPPAS